MITASMSYRGKGRHYLRVRDVLLLFVVPAFLAFNISKVFVRKISKEHFVFLMGVVLCSTVTTGANTFDRTLPIRNLIWGVTTLILFIMAIRSLDWGVLKHPIFVVFVFYCLVTGYTACWATNKGEVIYNFLRIALMIV